MTRTANAVNRRPSQKSTSSGATTARTQLGPKTKVRTFCPACGQTTGRGESVSTIFKTAILEALEAGPATTAEIDRRIGFKLTNGPKKTSTRTSHFMRTLERKGLVAKIRSTPGSMSDRLALWALVVEQPK